MLNKHMKIRSTLLVIREMQIKASRYHFTHIRMLLSKRQKITNVGKDMEKLEPSLPVHLQVKHRITI